MSDIPSLAALKVEASQLRETARSAGTPISQSEAYERLAGWYGRRDWNTLRALSLRNASAAPVIVGQRVQGRYLNQPFHGTVLGLHQQGESYRVTLQLDEPVDVVEFESFSNFRSELFVKPLNLFLFLENTFKKYLQDLGLTDSIRY